jgi:phage shock protein A
VAAADDEDSDESGSVPLGGDICRQNGSVKSGAARLSTGGCKELPTSFSLPMGKRNKTASSNLGTASIATGKDYVMYTAKLEADIKRLKAELQSSRCTEQELRSQINSLSSNQRTTKTELSQLRQDNDTLQSKLQKLLANRQQDKQNLATLERQVQEERKGKVSLEQQLAAEKQRRKTDESVAAAARSTARSSECVSEQCKSRRWDLENEIKQLRRELQIRDERTRQLERETQALHQKRGECQSETEVLMSALGAIQDKNAHLETSLSAETRLKLDLFSALGDAKRQLEIQQSLLMHKEMELAELKSKVAEVMAFLPAVTLTSFTTSPVRYSPSAYVSVGHPGLRGSSAGCVGSMEVADQTDATVVMGGAGGGMSPASQTGKSNLNPSASDYTPKITQ